jgi:hypothetical protein
MVSSKQEATNNLRMMNWNNIERKKTKLPNQQVSDHSQYETTTPKMEGMEHVIMQLK